MDRIHGCGGRNKRALTGVACLSLPAILALAEEISHQVSTCPSIMTGVGATVIDVWWRQLEGSVIHVTSENILCMYIGKYIGVGLF